MENSIRYKVPGGKLLIVRAVWDGRITKLELLGDFFVHPEEALNRIEVLLIGTKPDAEEAELAGTIKQFVDRNDVVLVGLSPEAIAKGVLMAVNG
ncbi:MAG: biotin--protein ligase [Candidatus Micrarchaeaceae archaeon]|nr:biotin--protein ligase [Candidatus Micrarchaeota archaeon]